MINVSQIKKGIVIDHIEAGHGFRIYKELHLDKIKDPVVLLTNVPSSKMGKKDMLKIETDVPIDMDVLGLIDPNVSINYVRNGVVTKKLKLTLPREVVGIMRCANPRCITQTEQELKHVFRLTDRVNKVYRCIYCETKAG